MKTPRSLLAALLGVFVSHATAADQTATWNNTSGNWSDFTKWSTNPLFPDNGNGGFTFDAVQNGGTLTVNQDITIEKLNMGGGTNTGAGFTLTLNDLLSWGGGTINGTGTINADGGATISGAVTLFQRTLNLGGNSSWTAGTINSGFPGSTLNNLAGGLLTTSFDGTMANPNSSSTFNNAGTFGKTSGLGTTTIAVALNNTGTVNVNSGTISATGGGTSTGAWNVDSLTTLNFSGGTQNLNAGTSVIGSGSSTIGFSAGTTNFNAGTFTSNGTTQANGGTANFNAAASMNVLNISSTLGGSGTVTASGLTTFSGGVINGSGVLNANGGATFSTSTLKQLDNSRVINLGGTSTWSGGELRLALTSTLTNTAGGVFATSFDGTMSNLNSGGTFNNAGTFTKSGATGTTTIAAAFNNSGTVNVSSGTLSLTGNGSQTGAFSVAGGTLQFASGTHNLNAGTSISGAGAVALTGGTLSVNVAVSSAAETAFNMSGGTLTGNGTLTINGPLNWSGGTMTGAGTVNADGGATISGNVTIFQRTLNLGGNSSWTAGTINSGFPGSTLNNVAGNTFITSFNGTMADPNTSSTFNNAGTFTKGGGTGITTIATAFSNSGTVNANVGTLLFNRTYTQTAGALVLSGGAVTRGADTNVFSINGGSVEGGGTITGTVATAAGTIAPGLGGVTGTLAITGNLTLTSASTVDIDLAGTTAGTQYDVITEAGTTALARNGVLAVRVAPAFLPTILQTDTFTVITSNQATSGEFSNVIGGRVTTVDGTGSFAVNAAGTNSVVLSDFQHLPEIGVSQGVPIADGGTFGFGTRTVGTPTALTFTISNTGFILSSLGTVTVDGANAGEFVVTQQPPSAVAASGSVTFEVTFTPTASGLRTAALHFTNGDTNESPYDINLTGTGNLAPELILPPAIVLGEATGPGGATVTFTVTATDFEDEPDPTAVATPASGSNFPIGDTTVNVTATDTDGATTNGTVTVRVQDTTPPTIAAPVGGFTPASVPAGTLLADYTGQAVTSDLVGVTSVTQSPAPGTITIEGTMPITLTAHDAANNMANVSFNLTVTQVSLPLNVIASTGTTVPGAGVDPRIAAGSTWGNFGAPAINDAGNVAFFAKINSSGGIYPAIFATSGGVPALVVKKGMPAASVSGGIFTNFKDPMQAPDGAVAFIATLGNAPGQTQVKSTNNLAIYLDPDGAGPLDAVLVARKGGDAAEVPEGTNLPAGVPLRAQWMNFTSIVLGEHALAFTATMANRSAITTAQGPGGVTAASDTGLWIHRRAAAETKLAVREGSPLPGALGAVLGSKVKVIAALAARAGSHGQGRGLESESGVDTLWARVTLADARQVVGYIDDDLAADGQWLHATGASATAYDPGEPPTWLSFGLPTQNTNGAGALLATVRPTFPGVSTANNVAIYAEDDVIFELTRLMTKGDAAPDVAGGVFSAFQDPVSGANQSVAFRGTLKTDAAAGVNASNNLGIWWRDPAGTWSLLARKGAQPPEVTPVTGLHPSIPPLPRWKNFISLALPEGATGPIFVASMAAGSSEAPGPGGVTTANDVGVWGVATNGDLRLVIREGDTIGGASVKTIQMLSTVLGSPAQTRSFNNAAQVTARVLDTNGDIHLVKIDIP